MPDRVRNPLRLAVPCLLLFASVFVVAGDAPAWAGGAGVCFAVSSHIGPPSPAQDAESTVTPTTSGVSVTPTGATGDGASADVAISADGRFVTFESLASDLVASDENGVQDVFVRDTVAGTTER